MTQIMKVEETREMGLRDLLLLIIYFYQGIIDIKCHISFRYIS